MRVSPSDPSRPDQRFQRSWRLTSRPEFLAVYDDGCRASAPGFTLFGRPNDRPRGRVGLTVSRKVGGAVVRNRVKRRLREIYRRHCRSALGAPLDLVVNAHASIVRLPTRRLEQDFIRCFHQLARKAGSARR